MILFVQLLQRRQHDLHASVEAEFMVDMIGQCFTCLAMGSSFGQPVEPLLCWHLIRCV